MSAGAGAVCEGGRRRAGARGSAGSSAASPHPGSAEETKPPSAVSFFFLGLGNGAGLVS